MTAEQRRLLRALVEEYVEQRGLRRRRRATRGDRRGGLGRSSRSRGAASVGDLDEPFYYRVQGPRIIIELRNTENHVHTVTRDPGQ